MAPANLLIGSGTYGPIWTQDGAIFLEELKKASIRTIDTAALYPNANPGASEKLLGELGVVDKGFLVDTKILWFKNGRGTLTEAAIKKSLSQSLESIKTDKFNVLYCHGPDLETPIAEQAAALDAEYHKGKFSKLGVSNFPPELLSEWLDIAEEKGYVKPTVFQGQFNLVCRTYESTLFPLLRKHGIGFNAYSPLAGGFLTGKVTFAAKPEDLKGTRFEASNNAGNFFRTWYDKPGMNEFVRKMDALCKPHDIAMVDAAHRWLVYHSILDGDRGDGIIIGSNTMAQFEKCVQGIQAGPLPDDLAMGLDELWAVAKDDADYIWEFIRKMTSEASPV